MIVDNVTAIRVTAKIPKGNVMQIFYSTEENPGYAENRAKVVTSDSDEMKEYLFDMSTALGWEGLLTGIRFDPVAAESVEVEIKSLEFLAKSQESSMEMTVNDLTFEMNLPYQKAENGDILAAFDPSLGMDLRLNTYAIWDKATETLTLNFTKHTLVFTVGSDSYTLDGEIKPLGYKIPTFDGLPCCRSDGSAQTSAIPIRSATTVPFASIPTKKTTLQSCLTAKRAITNSISTAIPRVGPPVR